MTEYEIKKQLYYLEQRLKNGEKWFDSHFDNKTDKDQKDWERNLRIWMGLINEKKKLEGMLENFQQNLI